MAAISSMIMAGAAVVSAGVGISGYLQQKKGQDTQVAAAQEQARIAGIQAQESARFALSEAELTKLASDQSYEAAAASEGINRNIIEGERGIEGQKYNAMLLDNKRAVLETLRDQQRKNALGITTATAQGAQFGSGVQGARAQTSGQTGNNLLGFQQNLEVGQNIFGYNAGITEQRIALGQLQTSYARQQADVTTRESRLKAEYAQKQADLTTASSAAGSNMATGQGQSAYGGSLIGAAQNIFSVGQVGARFGESLFNPRPTPINSGTRIG